MYGCDTVQNFSRKCRLGVAIRRWTECNIWEKKKNRDLVSAKGVGRGGPGPRFEPKRWPVVAWSAVEATGKVWILGAASQALFGLENAVLCMMADLAVCHSDPGAGCGDIEFDAIFVLFRVPVDFLVCVAVVLFPQNENAIAQVSAFSSWPDRAHSLVTSAKSDTAPRGDANCVEIEVIRRRHV